MPPSTPTAAGLQARRQFETPYYGLVNLALANLAYTDESAATIHQVYEDLPANVAKLPPLPGPSGGAPALTGAWTVDWGPCVSRENANLLYAASFRESGCPQPLVTIVAIRGTDTSSGRIGLFEQIIEDIDGLCTTPFPVGDPVQIAGGTRDGLNRLLGLKPASAPAAPQAGAGNIEDFVRGLVAADADLPVVVTGHSLGGCQTTVLATYLKLMLPQAKILPASIAAPTAGLADFAAQYDRLFPNGTQWWNTLDVVPNAFAKGTAPGEASLRNIHQFWQGEKPPGPSIDFALRLVLDGVIDAYPANYTQPSAGRQTLKGFVWTPPAGKCKNNWATQLCIQHFPPMYHTLMSQQTAVPLAPYPLPAAGTPDPCTNVTWAV